MTFAYYGLKLKVRDLKNQKLRALTIFRKYAVADLHKEKGMTSAPLTSVRPKSRWISERMGFSFVTDRDHEGNPNILEFR